MMEKEPVCVCLWNIFFMLFFKKALRVSISLSPDFGVQFMSDLAFGVKSFAWQNAIASLFYGRAVMAGVLTARH